MKRVLWVSRHEMSPLQLADLERALGEPLQLLAWRDTVKDVAELRPLLSDCDAIAVVLPLQMVAALLELAQGLPILQPIMERTPTGQMRQQPDGNWEPEFRFTHRYWQQIVSLRLETRRL